MRFDYKEPQFVVINHPDDRYLGTLTTSDKPTVYRVTESRGQNLGMFGSFYGGMVALDGLNCSVAEDALIQVDRYGEAIHRRDEARLLALRNRVRNIYFQKKCEELEHRLNREVRAADNGMLEIRNDLGSIRSRLFDLEQSKIEKSDNK